MEIYDHLIGLQIIFAVGTELQSILTKMALEITERHAVVQGIPLVQGSDKYFWFGRPHLILHLIHFALFQVYDWVVLLTEMVRYDESIEWFWLEYESMNSSMINKWTLFHCNW